MTEIETRDNFDLTIEIGRERAKGKTYTEIATMYDLSIRDVKKHEQTYKSVVLWSQRHDTNLSDRIGSVIEEVNEHYNMLTKEAWRNKEAAETQGALGTVNQAMKLIADVQKQRAQMFQQFTKDADEELLMELEETKKRQEDLIFILKKLKERFPEAASYIQKELVELTREPVEVEVLGPDESNE